MRVHRVLMRKVPPSKRKIAITEGQPAHVVG